MPIPAFRAKQSTDTAGTGTLVLNAAATNARSFNAAFGASARRIMYCISWSTGFEIGYGDFDGGTPGSLTRATVLASSNAGSLVTLPAGTKDVFAVFEPAAREVVAISGTATLALADLGNTVVFSGASAATLNLPAVATVPNGAGWLVLNAGTAAITIDPNGAETVSGAAALVLQAGQSAMMLRVSGAWQAALLGGTAVGLSLLGATSATAAHDLLTAPEVDVASAATTDIGAANSSNIRITGTTTITSFGSALNGVRRHVRFAAALTLTHNASSLILPGGANITIAAGDTAVAISLGSGNWVVVNYVPASDFFTKKSYVDAVAADNRWVQLSSTAITAVSQIDLTWTGGAYLAYKIHILGLRPGAATNNDLFIRVRRGGTFLAGATDYNKGDSWWNGTAVGNTASAESYSLIFQAGMNAEPGRAEIDLMQADSAERIIIDCKSRHTSNTPGHSRSWFTANTLAGSGWLDGARISFVGSATNFAAVGRIVVMGMKS
jgi:hypothetical protein